MREDSCFFAVLDRYFKPVFLKELHEAVNGRFMTVGLCFLTGSFLFTIGGTLLNDEKIGQTAIEVGPFLSLLLLGILDLAAFVIVPVYLSVRIHRKTTARGSEVIPSSRPEGPAALCGRVLSGFVFIALGFVVGLPYLIISWLLGGSNLVNLAFQTGWTLLLSLPMQALAVLTATVVRSRGMRLLQTSILGLLGGALGAGALRWIIAPWTGFDGGVSKLFVTTYVIAAAVFAVMTVSAALLSAAGRPPSADRAMPVRISLSFFWAGSALIISMSPNTTQTRIETWLLICSVILCTVLLSAAGERHLPSNSQLRRIRGNTVLTALALPWTTGGASAVLWVLLTAGGTVAVAHLSSGGIPGTLDCFFALVLCAYIPVISVLSLQLFPAFRRRFARHRVWVIPLIFAVLVVFPAFLAGFVWDSWPMDFDTCPLLRFLRFSHVRGDPIVLAVILTVFWVYRGGIRSFQRFFTPKTIDKLEGPRSTDPGEKP